MNLEAYILAQFDFLNFYFICERLEIKGIRFAHYYRLPMVVGGTLPVVTSPPKGVDPINLKL